jgi:type IX secretion system PorP/SprF family membrane protein
MKTKIIFILLSVLALNIKAQQETMISQYMFNGLFINPAYAGSHKYFSASLLYRNQWVNFEGAPKTGIVSVDGPIVNNKMGIGLVAVNDRIGITNKTDVYGNYAYHLQVNENSKLSFGIKAGFSNYNADFGDLKYWDKNDQVYQQGAVSHLLPRFGFGTYYYSEKFYAGISIPTLLAYDNTYSFNVDLNKASFLRRHLFVTTGYVFEVSESVKLKPSMLLKYVTNAPAEIDITMSSMFKDIIWLGVSYRSNDAVVGIIEYQANQRFRVGYAYDFTVSKMKNYNMGSHEIMIGYDFGKDFISVKTPRFF